MTVVRREKRRRWILVLASVVVLCAVPAVVAARPVRAPVVDAEALRDRIRASAGQPYEGYAESAGALGLPPLPRLGQVVDLLSGTTRMRAWHAAPDRWRVDVIDTGSERGVYRTPEGTYSWDYGANQLTYVEPGVVGLLVRDTVEGEIELTEITGESPARLPRGADLMPPDLGRRLLDMAQGERLDPIPGKRVAGIAAAGLRIIPTGAHSTVGHIDIWADPRTGLPLEVAVTARDAERAILVTRFLDVVMSAPAGDVLTPPAPDDVSITVARSPDTSAIFEVHWPFGIPDQLAGLGLREDARSRPAGNERRVVRLEPGMFYGTGLTQLVALPLSDRIDREVFRSASAWGQVVPVPGGRGAVIAAPLLSVMVVQVADLTFLIVGMIDAELMRRAGADLAGHQQ